MDEKTARALNAINRDFYRDRAAEFSETRTAPWPGWLELQRRLGPRLPQRELDVLDVGCGNGRFGAFLAEAGADCPRETHYVGIDSSEPLLEVVRRRSLGLASVETACVDVVETPPSEFLPDRSFTLIAVFGLLHHIPAERTRAALLHALGERLQPGGFLALAIWRFEANERIRGRSLPIEDWNRVADEPLDASQLEPGDRLLRWGLEPHCVRYCHHMDDAEAARLLAGTRLEICAQFDADGRDEGLNRYFVLRSRGTA
jgi:SAM-dependent methyltransferase